MIPLKLEFQAFGSYVQRQTVDFSHLENGDIFLINGKTGSGKTVIIDAIVFALYSKGSGPDRSSFAEMRSRTFGAESIPTEISFTFETKGKTYKFERRCFIRTKKKKDGTTENILETEQNAFELAEDGFKPVFENPKAKDLDRLAEEIIGLNHEQFTKVMVLPQGKFASFLTADSAEKEQILSTLFNVEKWYRIGDWICKKAREIHYEGADCNKNCQETLGRYGCGNDAELLGLCKESEDTLSQLEKDFSENEKLTRKLTKEREQLLVAQENFSQLDSLEKSFSQLEIQRPVYENLKQEISKNKSALEIEPYYTFCVQYNSELKKRRNYCDQVTVRLSDAEAVADSWAKRLEEINSFRTQIDNDKVKLQKMLDSRENVTLLTEENARLSQLENQLSQGKIQMNSLSERLEKAKKSALELENKQKIAYSQLAKLSQLTEMKKQIDEAARLEGEIQEISRDIRSNNDKISALDGEISKEKQKLSSSESHREERYNSYITNIAAAISQSLKEGEPCPVCGSIHHSKPINPPGDVATEEEILRLDKQIEQDRKQLSNLENQKALFLSQNSKLEKELWARKNHLSAFEPFTNEQKQQIVADYELSMNGGKVLEQVTEKLENLNKEKEEILKFLDELKNSSVEMEKEKALSVAKIQTISAELEKLGMENVTDLSQLEKSIAQLSEKIDRFNREKETAEISSNNASAQVITLRESRKSAQSEIDKAEKLLKDAQNDYTKIVLEKGFSGKKEYDLYHISKEEISKKETSLEEFIGKYNSTSAQLLQLREKLRDVKRPDIENVTNLLAEAEKSQKLLLSEKSALSATLETLRKDISYYNENSEKFRKLSKESERLMNFGKEIRGDNGIGLRRYVLGVMLDKIIDEANIILREIKDGQYSLFVNREKVGNKKQFGLDIFVLNNRARYPYSSRTLSGGEKFLVSLALSMALSSIVQMYAGGISIDTLFIDEGFGSLDGDVLVDSMNVLASASRSRKVVGIISHVDALKEAFTKKINVINRPSGSMLSVDF